LVETHLSDVALEVEGDPVDEGDGAKLGRHAVAAGSRTRSGHLARKSNVALFVATASLFKCFFLQFIRSL
jgi:hypothetical protein